MKKLNKILLSAGMILVFGLVAGCKNNPDTPAPESNPEKAKTIDVGQSMAASVSGVETFIASEDDLKAVIGDIAKEYSDFAEKMKAKETPAGPAESYNDFARGAKTSSEAVEQIKDFITKFKALEGAKAENGKLDFDVAGTIDIDRLSAAEWVEVYCEFSALANAGKEGAKTKEEIKAELEKQLKEESDITLDQAFALLDNYLVFNKLYLNAAVKSNIKVAAGETPTGEISANAAEKLDVAVVKLNEILSSYAEEVVSLPVNDISVVLDASEDVAATAEQIVPLINSMMSEGQVAGSGTTGTTSIPTLKTAKANVKITAKGSVCTADKKGGIITVELTLASDDLTSVIAAVMPIATSAIGSGDMSGLFTLISVINDVLSAKISVTDGSGAEKFAKNYDLAGLMGLLPPEAMAAIAGGFMGQ